MPCDRGWLVRGRRDRHRALGRPQPVATARRVRLRPRSSSSATATTPASSFPAGRSPSRASRRGLSALGYVATRFADYDRLEIGWGDEGFYREVPTARVVDAWRWRCARYCDRATRPFCTSSASRRPARDVSQFRRRPGRSRRSRASRGLADKLDATFARGPDGAAAGGTRTRALWDEPVLSRQWRISSLQRLQSLDRRPARCRAACRPRPCWRPCRSGLLLDLEWRSTSFDCRHPGVDA